MASLKGLGRLPHVRARSEVILAALHEHVRLTTNEVAAKTGIYYGTAYADLRRLCGSNTLPYNYDSEHVNADGYPVVWHTWWSTNGGTSLVSWSLTPDYRTAVDRDIASLSDLFALDSGGGEDRG